MKFKCTSSKSKSFIAGEVYESISVRGRDAFGLPARIPKMVSGEDMFDMECNPFVAFNKRGKVIAQFELITK